MDVDYVRHRHPAGGFHYDDRVVLHGRQRIAKELFSRHLCLVFPHDTPAYRFLYARKFTGDFKGHPIPLPPADNPQFIKVRPGTKQSPSP